MLRYNQFSNRFFDPDKGGSSGGSGGSSQGNPAANQGGAAEDNGSASKFVDPTANINLDDLDAETRKVIEESRKGFAALQKQTAEVEAARLLEEKQRKQFQAGYDQLTAQIKKGQSQQQQTDPKTEQLEKFTQILVKRGVTAEQAKVQAEIMLEMMGDFGTAIKAEIGAGLGPMAQTMVAREAEFAWGGAAHNDRTGAMQIDSVAKEAWAQVETLVQTGQTVNEAVVKNLVGMAYFNYLQQGGTPVPQQQQQQVQQQQVPQFQTMGRPPFTGGGHVAQRPVQHDANAPKYQLDSDTDAALQVVMGKWATGQGGVKAPGYRAPATRK